MTLKGLVSHKKVSPCENLPRVSIRPKIFGQHLIILPVLQHGMDTLPGDATLSKCFFLPCQQGTTIQGKNVLPREHAYIPWHTGRKTENHMIVSLVKVVQQTFKNFKFNVKSCTTVL